jgi:hypothetical protein
MKGPPTTNQSAACLPVAYPTRSLRALCMAWSSRDPFKLLPSFLPSVWLVRLLCTSTSNHSPFSGNWPPFGEALAGDL